MTVTGASNNYAPFQFPEILISLMICNAFEDKLLPFHRDGMQVRDWLFVDDHCRAIWAALSRGEVGQLYNIGGSRALPNRTVVELILRMIGKPQSQMTTVADRPGHDRRYAITTEKLERATGWKALVSFEDGLSRTIDWYWRNSEWFQRVRSGAYQEY